jgi:gp32 DNA binding protein like
MDISLALKRFSSLQNNTKKSDSIWKPANGKSQIRLVPYKFNKDNPFIELYFHYNINNKTYLSPISFGRPDPIVEFAEKLKRTGDTDDWKAGKKMEPKLRTFAPVIVRGKENEGVKFWGFGKTVYQDILGYIADPDYGDITDPHTGRDIVLEVTSAEESNAAYPTTTIRVKPATSKILDDPQAVTDLLNAQKEITELYSELSYDELKGVLESWLNPSAAANGAGNPVNEALEAPKTQSSISTDMGGTTPKPVVDKLPWDEEEIVVTAPAKPAPKAAVAKDDVESAFDDLFNN